MSSDWPAYVQNLGKSARRASQQLATLTDAVRSRTLRTIAAALRDQTAALLAENAKDIEAAKQAELAAPLIARLQLTEKKVAAMAEGVEQIAAQVDPVGQTIEGYNRPNGLRIEKRRVPLGVVLFFYESRPNVTSDAAALCIKSGNAIILRGGKEAFHSNRKIVQIVADALKASEIDPAAVQFVESTDRTLVPLLLKQDKYIDLVIPRGGESLIRLVVKESTIPVLKHFTGNCHIYVDKATAGMEQQVVDICLNAKLSYTAACNAVEHLLFHKDVAPALLPKVCAALAAKGVEIRGDDRARSLFTAAKAATPEDWDTEYLALIAGVKVVDSLDEAVAHINEHGSHHTDAILTTDLSAANRFVQQVDSASVMINSSTRFADGGEYGLGAEIGISTDKMHARGPMGAMDLTTYKWVVTGAGHVR
ncbi:glutamate-5-semialdehyde dehydrogenase [Humisphaera borealis]|uniref:Gamma-glutamyl phosphate reductase n=1 Tax=Humisphaera borealis TaxID=2807512 RepID=A0A7M2X1U3_9BACT|nr:glutamate-5-semialdehyde dehydrogenase [Humisphaera borealis]QOV91645.1 glutamate-5-semialdehyde dehydrogenase [Humisphaera borealis]